MRSSSFAACAALAVILAGCSHGASGVSPTVGIPASHVGLGGNGIGPDIGTAKPVCAPVPLGQARCFAWQRTDVGAPSGAAPNIIPGYHPADLQAAYELPSLSAGTGQTIALVDAFDDPNAESDLGVYRAEWGESACTTANGCFQKVNQYGQPSPLPAPDTTGWSVEETLDVDMASAICPNCKIILVEAKTNQFYDLAQGVMSAVKLGATAISNSYGGGEQGTQPLDRYYKHRHAIVTASTGDSGYGVQYPASSPWVVAVGGTQLNQDSKTHRGWTEVAWRGGGSGCSTIYAKPSWQSDPLCTMRMEADTSAVASPATGVAIYDTYKFGHGWLVEGGTSVSSPIVASIYELKGNSSTADYGSRLYRTKLNHLWDVTSGSNGSCGGTYFCTAGPGYDGPTGMGTPHGDSAY